MVSSGSSAGAYPTLRPAGAVDFDAQRQPQQWVESASTVGFHVEGQSYRELASGAPLDTLEWSSFNALTGPLGVLGALPGGVLEIRVQSIQIEEAWGVWVPGLGSLGKETKRLRIRSISITSATLDLGDSLAVPLTPSIGCLGVAPLGRPVSAMGPCGPWGGNWDAPWVAAGSTVYLPIEVDGARLYVGDLHAAAGGGEPAAVGIEAAGTAVVSVTQRSRRKVDVLPRVETASAVFIAGFGKSLQGARDSAIRRGYRYLTRSLKLADFAAQTVLAATANLHFGGPASPMVWIELPVWKRSGARRCGTGGCLEAAE